MKPWSKKAVLSLSVVSGIVVVVAAGFALKRPVLEQWYLWQLESEDEQERKSAAERLGEMGSVRAMPVILGIFQRTGSELFTIVYPPESYVDTSRAFVVKAEHMSLEPSGLTITMPSRGIEFQSDADGQAVSMWLMPGDSIFLLDALWKLTSVAGKKSVPYLVTALDDEGWYVAHLAASLLGRIGPNARGAIPALTTALQHENELVRHAAAIALKKIQNESRGNDQQG